MFVYVTRLEEARVWLSQCLNEDMPSLTEIEKSLTNGVTLAKIAHFVFPNVFPLSRLFDLSLERYRDKGLEFRHTDNINFWIQCMEKLGLPKVFFPTTTDLYDMKNMPRVVYCIHALSIYLAKLGKGPAMQSLTGEYLLSCILSVLIHSL